MQNHLINRDYRLPREFEIAGKFYAPTTGILAVSLINQDGTVLHSDDLPANNPSLWFVSGDVFTLDQTERLKLIFLNVEFMSDEGPKTYAQSFRLIKFKPITITPERVLAEIGAERDEVDIGLIDPYMAYCELTEKLGMDLFDDPKKAPEANQAILAQLVLNLLPTLALKLKASQAIDDYKFTRNPLNITQLTDSFASRLFKILSTHFGYEDTTSYEPLITFATRTDIITGA